MKLPKSHSISTKMLVIRAGKMGKLVFKHLASKGCKKIGVVQAPVEVHIPWGMKCHNIFWVIASSGDRAWNARLALGNIAFAYTFADVLIEIQNTLKSPPAENKTIKKAIFYDVGLTTVFYLTLECTRYTAFGNNAPGNILTGFGFYEPFWLFDIANICIIVHLLGAYQGGSKIQEAYLIFQDFSEKYQMFGMILNGQAICCVHMGRFDGS